MQGRLNLRKEIVVEEIDYKSLISMKKKKDKQFKMKT